MSDKLIIEIDARRVAELHKQLGYIRCWVDGFQAAGKQGPHAIDALRQIQVLLSSAKPAKPPKVSRKANSTAEEA